jgi:D-galactarolactone cycloisomerase
MKQSPLSNLNDHMGSFEDSAKVTSGLRIRRVRIHKLRAPLREPFGWSLGWTDHRTATLVEVTTDNGITGWGDGAAGERELLARPELLLGRPLFEVDGIYEDLRASAGHQERRGASLCGGLDSAIWDALGQAVGLPVSNLLGTRKRSAIRPYCTSLYRKHWPNLEEGLCAEAVQWKERGFRTIKMKTGYGAETDVRIVKAVRSCLGEGVDLAIDSNCAYSAGAAVALGSRLEELNLLWWEEPLLSDDLAGYARLRDSIRIPIAGGETLSADVLIRDYIQTRLVDVLQPEVEIIGLTGARRITPLCWLNHIQLAPHNWGTAVRTAAILQWMATVPQLTPALEAANVTFEFDQTESPFRDAVVESGFALNAQGMIEIPQLPGLGVRVIPEAVAEFRQDLIVVE